MLEHPSTGRPLIAYSEVSGAQAPDRTGDRAADRAADRLGDQQLGVRVDEQA